MKINDNITYFTATETQTYLAVKAISDSILQFTYDHSPEPQAHFSYAIAPVYSTSLLRLNVREHKNYYSITTLALKVVVAKSDLSIEVYTKKGRRLSADMPNSYTREESGEISLRKQCRDKEQFFGLGDKPCALNLHGKKLELWGTDSFAYGAETDPIYKNIPFYISLYKQNYYGVFLDNSYRTTFDFNNSGNGQTIWNAAGGQLNYYFIYAPTPLEIIAEYTRLTGLPELPPLWALGYHQCKWSYYPETHVREIAEGFRARQIPCDAIWLDIDYMDGYRCFTWDKKHFPNPPALIADLQTQGFKTVVMIDPGIKVDKRYTICKSGLEADIFCKTPEGAPFVGKVWPGDCHFPDFTDPQARQWWQNCYKQLLQDYGVAGVWNDMNEPACFEVDSKTFPDNVQHHYEGNPTDHRQAHNVYGMQMARATYEAAKYFAPEKRPFVLTRSTFAGGQRYAAGWTGDNIATWEHLQIANIQCQRLSASGFSFIGSDIGGFYKTPDGELFVRWLQLGIFHPFCRTHSIGYDLDTDPAIGFNPSRQLDRKFDQEPWAFGETFAEIAKDTIEWRYRFLPYLYTAFRQYAVEGKPMLQSLALAYPKNKKARQRDREFLVGEKLLVSPIISPMPDIHQTYLPKGIWYHFFNQQPYKGKRTVHTAAPIDEFSLFVKAGTVLLLPPPVQYVGEKTVEQMPMCVYYTHKNAQTQYYEDAGEGYAYIEGNCRTTKFVVKGGRKKMNIRQKSEGDFVPTYTTYAVQLVGLPFVPKTIKVDGKSVLFGMESNSFVLNIDVNFNELVIKG